MAAIASIFGTEPIEYIPVSIFVLAPGAFFVLAALTAIQNRVKRKLQEKGKNVEKIQSGCNSDCANCGEGGCEHRFIDMNATGTIADNDKNGG